MDIRIRAFLFQRRLKKLRKLNVENYDIIVLRTGKDGEPEEATIPYDVKKSIEGVVLATGPSTEQRLSMLDLLRNARIVQKITMSKDGSVLLEEAEFQHVKRSFGAFRGFGVNDVELCKRIESAKPVEVEVKDKK